MRRYCLITAIMAAACLAAPVVKADDDQIAQHIYQVLKTEQQNGNLRGYKVDMRVDRGTVWFKGYVSNADQEMLILRTAQQAGRLGVVQVVDDIDVKGMAVAPMAQPMAQTMQPMAQTMQPMRTESIAREPALPVSYNPANDPGMQTVQAAAPMQMPVNMQAGIAQGGPTAVSQMPVNVAANTGNPMPVAYAGGMGMTTDNPQLPGYAWPAYAAYPNYAAVSYPRQYSASAWPYIGPFYPYPQVPLGWRSVTLEWDDGWWYLDFNDRTCGH